jgi:glycosyltransferase involved in cell wall biosynthesis
VLPSHQENFGIVVAEAMACSLPVIISDKVNIWREIDSYEAGFVANDTIEGTTASMRRWSELATEDIAALRIRSRKCFNEMFDFNVTSKKVLENVEQLARSTPRYRTNVPMSAMNGTKV